MKYKYFPKEEFDRCTPPCHISDMHEFFMRRLDTARDIAEIPFILTSAYRSVDYELQQGRDGTSTHTKGLAVDIAYKHPTEAFKIVDALMAVGFSRIILYKSWIHVDADPEKVKPILKHGK